MKKINKKITALLLIFVMMFPEVIPLVNISMMVVSANVVEITGLDGDGNLKLDLNESKTITVTNSEINICEAASNDDSSLVTTMINPENNSSCIITAKNYGTTYVRVSLSNGNTKYFFIDIETDDYLDTILDSVPDSMDVTYNEYLDIISTTSSNEKIFRSYDIYNCTISNNVYTCPYSISYRGASYFDDTTSQSITYYPNGGYKYLTKNVTFNIQGIRTMGGGQSHSVSVGSTIYLGLTGFSSTYDKIYFASEDPNIAYYDESDGIIHGVSVGNTNIYVFDTNNDTFYKIPIGVYSESSGPVTSDSEVIEFINENYNNSHKTINLNTDEIVFSSNDGSVSNRIFNRDFNNPSQYIFKYDLYLNDELSNTVNSNFPNISFYGVSSSCENNVCNATYRLSNQEYSVGPITYDLDGIYVDSTNAIVGESIAPFNIVNYTSIPSDQIVTIIANQNEYFDLEGAFLKAKKFGITNVTVSIPESDYSFTNVIKISDRFVQGLDETTSFEQAFIALKRDLKELAIPYVATAFTNHYEALASLINNEILSQKINDTILENHIEVNTVCFSETICNVLLYAYYDEEQTKMYSQSSTIPITIDYSITHNDNELAFSTIKEIPSKGSLSLNSVISIYDACVDNEECIVNSLLTASGIKEKLDISSKLQVLDASLNEIIENTYSTFNVVIGVVDSDVTLYEKNVVIDLTSILSISPSENNSTLHISNIVRDIVAEITDVDPNNININYVTENIYNIEYGLLNYNIVINQKEEIKYTTINFEERLKLIDLDETTGFTYFAGPSNANSGRISFSSTNPEVMTVNPNGTITGVSRGVASLEYRIDGSKGYNRVIILVDMTLEEYLDEMLENGPTSVIVPYGMVSHEAVWQGMDTVLENLIRDKYEEDLSVIEFSVNEYETDNYHYKICYNDMSGQTCSDNKNITYTLKGIYVENGSYDLDVNETIDTKLSFTEADNINLIIRYDVPGVAEISKEGILKGLTPGVVTIEIVDKLNKYYNYLSVIVDEAGYTQKLVNDVNNLSSVTLEASYIGEYMKNDGTDEDNAISSLLSNKITDMVFSLGYNISVDNLIVGENTFDLSLGYYDFGTDTFEVLEKTIPYEIKGVYVEEDYLSLETAETYELSLHAFPVTLPSNITYESSDTSVCTVNNGVVTAVDTGVCFVKVTYNNNSTSVGVTVNEEDLINSYKDLLNSLPNEITINAPRYDTDKDDWIYESSYNNMLFEYIIDELLLDNESSSDLFGSSFRNLDENDMLPIVIDPSFRNEEDNRFISLGNIRRDESVKILFEYNAEEHDQEEINQILGLIPLSYQITLKDFLRSKLLGGKPWMYTDFVDVLEDYPEYRLIFYENFGGGGMSFSATGGCYALLHNEEFVGFGETEFIFYYADENGNTLSQEEYTESLRNVIMDEYVSVEQEISQRGFRMFSAPNITDEFPEDELMGVGGDTPEVSVTFIEYNNGYENYDVSVNGISFILPVLRNASGNGTYDVPEIPGPETPPVVEYVLGDLTGDNQITGTDLVKMRRHLAGIETLSENRRTPADINRDGNITGTDLAKMRKHLAGIETIA